MNYPATAQAAVEEGPPAIRKIAPYVPWVKKNYSFVNYLHSLILSYEKTMSEFFI